MGGATSRCLWLWISYSSRKTNAILIISVNSIVTIRDTVRTIEAIKTTVQIFTTIFQNS